MIDMKTKMTPEEYVIWKLNNVIKGQAMFTREATYMSDEQKMFELQALADIRDYINHYKEYKQVIEQYKQWQKDNEER